MLLCNYSSYGNVAFMHEIRLRRVGEKSFLYLIIVWKIQIKLLFEAYLDVETAHKLYDRERRVRQKLENIPSRHIKTETSTIQTEAII